MHSAARSRRPLAGALLAGLSIVVASVAVTIGYAAPPAEGAAAPSKGYWLGASDGGIFGFGDAAFFGSTGAITLNQPVVGMAATSSGKGYWEVASDGGVFNFGDARFFGSTGAITLNKPIVGMAATPSGKGYWLVASDGGIFGFGDAVFHGSTGGITLAKPIVGMASSPSGKGYWLVASDGGIFAFGDAKFLGSTGALRLNLPMVAMAASPTGLGYWLVGADGGIFNFGDAAFFGSTGAIRLNRRIVAMAATPGVPAVVTDTAKPAVTVKKATGQADPTKTAPVNFTVTFGESVSGFTTADVTVGGTAGGTKTATVTGSGATYNVAVSGMTTSGTVSVSIAAGVATDTAGNVNTASNTDISVTYDVTAPAVTVNQAGGQPDPTNASPVGFTVAFSEPVTGFTSADVTVGGTAGGTKTTTVTGNGATYNLAVSGMTTGGTVTASVAGAAASDAAGNGNAASTSTDNTVTYDSIGPTVTVNQAGAQADPTNTGPIGFAVTFSEPVTGFTNADVVFSGSAAGGTLAAAVTGGPAVYDVAVTGMGTSGSVVVSVASGAATDAAGNPSSTSTSTDNTVAWETTAPMVTSVSSTTAAGVYKAGDVVSIQVNLSEAVTVTGTPTLALNTGATGTYSSGSGTSTLNFTYTVGAGQNTGDLDYAATTSLALAGGTVRDAATNDALLTLPTPGAAGSLAANEAIVVDTTAPTVTGVNSPTANGVYNAGAVIAVEVSLSEAVTVTGTPTLALNSGGTATYVSGSGTSTLTFTYTVASGESTLDLDYAATTSLALAAGTIVDLVGNSAVLTLPAPGGPGSLAANKAIAVDTTAATVTGVASDTADGAYNAADTIAIEVGFGESVNVTGTPTLALNTGGSATYTSGSGTPTLTFAYTVGAGETASDLDYATTGSLSTNGGAITDTAGNSAVLTLPAPGAPGSLGAAKALVVDTTAATVTGVTANTVNGSYNAGDSVSIQVVFSEPVNVTGTPALALNTGGSATYTSGSGTSTLTLTYTIAGGHNAADLDYAATSSFTTGGGTISDSAGNSAVLTLPAPGAPGSLGAAKAIVVDTVDPVFQSITTTHLSDIVTVTFSEPVDCTTVAATDFVFTLDSIPLGGNTVVCSGGSDATIDLVLGIGPVFLGEQVSVSLSGTVTDVAGNAAAPVTRTDTV